MGREFPEYKLTIKGVKQPPTTDETEAISTVANALQENKVEDVSVTIVVEAATSHTICREFERKVNSKLPPRTWHESHVVPPAKFKMA